LNAKNPFTVEVADLNGDGALDLVSGNQGDYTLAVFLQTEKGKFAAYSGGLLGGPETTRGPVSILAADLDGDGDNDLASANMWSHTLTIFFQTDPGEFAQEPLEIRGVSFPQAIDAADLDGDGDLDLVCGNVDPDPNADPDTLTVFHQTAPGEFVLDSSGPLGGTESTDGPGSLLVVDLDGDGDPDIVSANRSSNNITAFFGGR
jgi:hypothetical protein